MSVLNVYDQSAQNTYDIVPKKLAIKYHPAVLALEYYHSRMNNNYLLQIDLEDEIKSRQDPNQICNKIFSTYCDVFNKQNMFENQIIGLIHKILENKFNKNKNETFEPTLTHKDEGKEFNKSSNNFFKSAEINLEDQTEMKEISQQTMIKSEFVNLNKINSNLNSNNILITAETDKNFVNGKIDYNENYYSNDMSIESLNSN